MAELDNNSGDPPVFQSFTIDEEITCKRLSLRYFGDTNGVNANLAVKFVEIDGLDELEVGSWTLLFLFLTFHNGRDVRRNEL